jgi:hypothetical protein
VQHCTPEQLALAALREPLPDDDAAHLESCATCRAEVASLRRGVDALAVPQLAAPGASVPPPPAVWSAIAAATGVSAIPRSEMPAAASAVPASTPAEPAGGTVLPFRSRRRPLLAAAAAVVAGAVIGAGAVAVLQRDDDDAQQVTAIALDPLADNDASGTAEIVRRGDGGREVRLDLDAPQLEDAYYELWLIDRDVVGMVPLGVAQAGSNVYELPDGLELGEFPLVDVSVEPLDGNPEHSGVSVCRGELES